MESTYLESQELELVWDKIFIVHDENGNRVETKTFFSLPFDLILQPFVKELRALYEWKPGMSGMQPYPPVAVFKAILYAKLNKNMSDRELERHYFEIFAWQRLSDLIKFLLIKHLVILSVNALRVNS